MAKLIRVFDSEDEPIRVQFFIDPSKNPVLADWYRQLPHGGVAGAIRETLEAGLVRLGLVSQDAIGQVAVSAASKRQPKRGRGAPKQSRGHLVTQGAYANYGVPVGVGVGPSGGNEASGEIASPKTDQAAPRLLRTEPVHQAPASFPEKAAAAESRVQDSASGGIDLDDQTAAILLQIGDES